jgi:hypothetical protein
MLYAANVIKTFAVAMFTVKTSKNGQDIRENRFVLFVVKLIPDCVPDPHRIGLYWIGHEPIGL